MAPPKKLTRAKDPCIYLYNESSAPIPMDGSLPTVKDVDKAVDEKLKSGIPIDKALDQVTDEVIGIWSKLVPDIQLQTHPNIRKVKLQRLRKARLNELKFKGLYRAEGGKRKDRKGKKRARKRASNFLAKCNKLFGG